MPIMSILTENQAIREMSEEMIQRNAESIKNVKTVAPKSKIPFPISIVESWLHNAILEALETAMSGEPEQETLMRARYHVVKRLGNANITRIWSAINTNDRQALLNKLPRRDRLTFMLFFLEGLSLEECASITNICPSAFDRRIKSLVEILEG